VNGLVVVDKPAGMTSHDVVDLVRRRFGERRVGHGGTLDPDATGVLLVGVGAVTRLLRFVTALPKRYTGEVVLGVETSTLDASGEVVARHDMAGVTIDDVRRVIASELTGEIQQVPPMVSAVRIGGRRLHELARAGVEVERQPRPVSVFHFDVAPTTDRLVFALDVTCSSGTYVRSLAADVGRLLGGGAHLRDLRRRAVGTFTEHEAAGVADTDLLPPAAAVRDLATVAVSDEVAALVAHGRVLPAFSGEGPWAVLDAGGELLAVYEPFRGAAKPAVVLSSELTPPASP
jgi:tRNA pseudouridine55 synthase